MRVITNYKTTLSQNINSTQSTIPVASIQTSDSTPHTITSADFDDVAFLVIEPGGANQEIIEVTDVDATVPEWTGATRGLAFYGGGAPVSVAGNKKSHQAGSTVIMSNVHWYYDELMDLTSAETVTGVKTFASGATPISIDQPTGGTQLANKTYVDTHGSGPTYYDQNIIAGVAGENLTVGWAVYLKTSDGKWYGTQASSSSTSEGVILGIAQATVLSGASTTILIGGVDKNQSGLVAGTTYFLSDTKGLISSSVGTLSVVIGKCNTVTTQLVVSERFTQVPTGGEKAALAGDSTTIAVGSGNKYVTQTGQQNRQETYATSSGSTNAYVLTLSPVPTALLAGQEFEFKANFTNTGAATLNVNSLGAIAVKKLDGATPLISGDIVSGQIVKVKYDGTNFQMLSPTGTFSSFTNGTIANQSSLAHSGGGGTNTDVVVTHGLGVTPGIIEITSLIGAPSSVADRGAMVYCRFNASGTIISCTNMQFLNAAGTISGVTTTTYSLVSAANGLQITVSLISIGASQFTFRINATDVGTGNGSGSVTSINWVAYR